MRVDMHFDVLLLGKMGNASWEKCIDVKKQLSDIVAVFLNKLKKYTL